MAPNQIGSHSGASSNQIMRDTSLNKRDRTQLKSLL